MRQLAIGTDLGTTAQDTWGVHLIVVPDYLPTLGGLTTQATNQARGLLAAGRPVVVLTRRHDWSWARRERIAGIDVRRFGVPGRSFAMEKTSLFALWWLLAMQRSSIRMVQAIMYSDFAAMAVLTGLGARTIAVWGALGEASDVIGTGTDPLRSLLHRWRRRILRRCRHVALTPAMQDELESVGLPARIIPVPVDGKRFRQPTSGERDEARSRIGLLPDHLAVIYTGRFNAGKGLDRLVAAVGTLVENDIQAQLLLVGTGDVAPLVAAVKDAGLESVTIMPGEVGDVREYLWAADVFVLPSLREGLSNSLAEAMSCGVVCVAAEAAGGDQVLYGGAGVVPPSSSTADLADALFELARRPDLRATLRRTAAERARMFSVGEVTAGYLDLVGEHIDARTSHAGS